MRHRENGVVYEFDVTKCMFSSGNGTEKDRISRLAKSHETVLDLYAGIGYLHYFVAFKFFFKTF